MKKFLKRRSARQRGQAIVEYVILVAVVALAALFAIGAFSDRLRDIMTGITRTLGGSEEETTAGKTSVQIIQDMDKGGVDAN